MAAHENLFAAAVECFAERGVDAEKALAILDATPVSVNAWQGDDVTGFEAATHDLTGGCQVTGNHPGRARTAEELRADLDVALKLIPGQNRVCLQGHQIDPTPPGRDRDAFTAEQFAGWLAWAKERKLGMDIAPAFYSHQRLDHGFSLSHPDPEVRRFWIGHGRAIRRIGAEFARALGTPSVVNQWAPDGMKDTPADRLAPRRRLIEALDEIFADAIDESLVLDAVESKLFGIGVESYTVGSHDLVLGYTLARGKLVCLDSGHFHPTESVADKISAVAALGGRILLHVSRGVRWDSDHVLSLNDELLAIAREVVRSAPAGGIYIGLDYFDASIDRVAAWVVGARNMRKALLVALLEPFDAIAAREQAWDFSDRFALQEAAKTLPWGVVWNEYCRRRAMPLDHEVMAPINAYAATTAARG